MGHGHTRKKAARLTRVLTHWPSPHSSSRTRRQRSRAGPTRASESAKEERAHSFFFSGVSATEREGLTDHGAIFAGFAKTGGSCALCVTLR